MPGRSSTRFIAASIAETASDTLVSGAIFNGAVLTFQDASGARFDSTDLTCADEGVALRGTFLLDREGIVRHAVVNDLALGRSVLETLRTLDAVRHIDDTGELCPANWSRGERAMVGTPAGVVKYLREFKLDP